MNKQHDNKLWEDYHKTGSVEARNALVVRYTPLVRRVAKDVWLNMCMDESIGFDFDDLVQAGLIRLMNIIPLIKSTEVSSYIFISVKGSLYNTIRMRTRSRLIDKPSVFSFGFDMMNEAALVEGVSEMHTDPMHKVKFVQHKRFPDSPWYNAQQEDLLQLIRKSLSSTRAEVVIQRFFEEKEDKEIADSLGITCGGVSSSRYYALRKLRTIFETRKYDLGG